MTYLCIRVSLKYEGRSKRFFKKFLKKNLPKIWRFQKYDLPLRHFPLRNYEAKVIPNGSLNYWFY